uniref:Uncharacterized protein n=1 Tax=Panagrolaimus sp. ES5 TaxID=591445 RepID=A0AC34FC98_9BILA
MKSVIAFSIFLLLFTTFQSSDAVKCVLWTMEGTPELLHDVMQNKPNLKYENKTKKVDVQKPITCLDACVLYYCEKNETDAFSGGGCPRNFYDTCSFSQKLVDEVKNKGPNNLDYHSDDFTIFYVSGCAYETYGRECMSKKAHGS